MRRTQIQLTDEQHRLLRTAARRRGVSMAEAVRLCITRFLQKEPQQEDLYARAAALIGKFEDHENASDLSARHDDYLDGAYR